MKTPRGDASISTASPRKYFAGCRNSISRARFLPTSPQSSLQEGHRQTRRCLLGGVTAQRMVSIPQRVFRKSAPQGRRHKAWGFNPRKRVTPTPSSPEGAQAARTGQLAACAPLGLLEREGCLTPGVETPGFTPTPLRG